MDCFLLLKANANGIVFKKTKPDYSEFLILIKKTHTQECIKWQR